MHDSVLWYNIETVLLSECCYRETVYLLHPDRLALKHEMQLIPSNNRLQNTTIACLDCELGPNIEGQQNKT